MNSYKINLSILSCLIIISGCDISLKRKNTAAADSKVAMSHTVIESKVKSSSNTSVNAKASFSKMDSKLIALYYADESNAIILNDMAKQTFVSKKQAKKLVVSKNISNKIQVIPLPLELEKILSPLPRYTLRVQVGKRVILMDVKSRQILDMIITKL